MKRLWRVMLFACATGTSASAASELLPFTAGTLAEIKTRHAGRPFVLTLWSLTCHYCAKELATLGQLMRPGNQPALVIVSTDTPDDEPEIRAALARHGLGQLDTWVFADAVPERLRRAIDPAWRGELPRTYLFDAAHRGQVHSGLLEHQRIADWLRPAQAVQ